MQTRTLLFALAGLVPTSTCFPIPAALAPRMQAADAAAAAWLEPKPRKETMFKRMAPMEIGESSRGGGSASMSGNGGAISRSSSFHSARNTFSQGYDGSQLTPFSASRGTDSPQPFEGTRAGRYLQKSIDHQLEFDEKKRTYKRVKEGIKGDWFVQDIVDTKHHGRKTAKAFKSVFSGKHVPSGDHRVRYDGQQNRLDVAQPLEVNRWRAALRTFGHASATAGLALSTPISAVKTGVLLSANAIDFRATSTHNYLASKFNQAAHDISIQKPHLDGFGVAKEVVKATGSRLLRPSQPRRQA